MNRSGAQRSQRPVRTAERDGDGRIYAETAEKGSESVRWMGYQLGGCTVETAGARREIATGIHQRSRGFVSCEFIAFIGGQGALVALPFQVPGGTVIAWG